MTGQKRDLDFSTKKCKRLHLINHEQILDYFINERNSQTTKIQNVEEERDLGVIVDKNLNFNSHITYKINIANRNLGFIKEPSPTWINREY